MLTITVVPCPVSCLEELFIQRERQRFSFIFIRFLWGLFGLLKMRIATLHPHILYLIECASYAAKFLCNILARVARLLKGQQSPTDS